MRGLFVFVLVPILFTTWYVRCETETMFRFIGSASDDSVTDLDSTDDGGFVVVGRRDWGESQKRLFVTKFDKAGNEKWTTLLYTCSEAVNDSPKSILAVGTNYFVLGLSRCGYSETRVLSFLIKLNIEGTILWTEWYGCDVSPSPLNHETELCTIREVSGSNLLISGTTRNSRPSARDSNTDFAFLKVSQADGSIVFSTAYFSANPSWTQFDYGYDAMELADGNIIFIGAAPMAFFQVVSPTGGDIGNGVDFGQAPSIAKSVVQTGDGNVVIAGRNEVYASHGTGACILSKLNPYADLSSMEVWNTVIGTTGYQICEKVIVLSTEDSLVAIGTSNSDDSSFIVKISNSTGTVLWIKLLNNGESETYVKAVAEDKLDGNIIVTGSYKDDFFVQKIRRDGTGCGLKDYNPLIEYLTELDNFQFATKATYEVSGYLDDYTISTPVPMYGQNFSVFNETCTVCEHGYVSHSCLTTYCYGILSNQSDAVCFGHGSCIGENLCNCSANYYGINCNITDCGGILSNSSNDVMESEMCFGHGTCDIKTRTCNCSNYDIYSGDICEIWYCSSQERSKEIACSGIHGICVDHNVCNCSVKYEGQNCEYNKCFGFSNLQNKEVCGGHGTCVGVDTCFCDNGYSSEFFNGPCTVFYCGVQFHNSSEACGGHGMCYASHKCNCSIGYSGETCNNWYCGEYPQTSRLVCSSHGKCIDSQVCNCSSQEYSGTECELWFCDGKMKNDTENVCSGNGECSGPEDCSCEENYSGPNCDTYYCGSFKSSEHSKVCSGHGECLSPFQCNCTSENYVGDVCEIWYCGNFHRSSPLVCNGHGKCIDSHICNCSNEDFYVGMDCETWYCDEIMKNDTTNVCNGHGKCEEHDECDCEENYSGRFCDDFYCGLFKNKDERICGGKGKCITPQKCNCEDGYEGNECNTWSCGGIDKNDEENVCNGKGKCRGPRKCRCSGGYGGDTCQNNLMYVTVMTPVLSVSFVLFLICGCGCLLVCAFITCCLIVFCCIVVTNLMGGLLGYIFKQKKGIQKFNKLKNFDLLLKEQELDEDSTTTVAHIKIDKTLYVIPYDEIKLLQILGEGGSNSVVYKAEWKNQIVAFKCFKTRSVCGNQHDYDEFEKEVRILGSVSHPFILSFYGSCLSPPRVGILMEFCSNGDMVYFLGTVKEWDYPRHEKSRLCYEICSAMDYLHSRNIIHRDLKLENILITNDEKTKLMDFGLSRIFDRMSVVKTKKIGTSHFIAPEVLISMNYDEKVDVYSFSIMLWIIFCNNVHPYGLDILNVEMKVANNPSFRPDSNEVKKVMADDTGFSSWITEIMERCWNHDSEKRLSFAKLTKMFQEKLREESNESSAESSSFTKKEDTFLVEEEDSDQSQNEVEKEDEETILRDRLKKAEEIVLVMREENVKLKEENEKLRLLLSEKERSET